MYSQPSNKKPLIVYALFFIVIFCPQTKIVSAHESKHENTVIVHVNEERFEPDTINIKIGTEVVFENVGTEEHWPAADDHPSHTLYDGTSLKEHCMSENHSSFDACQGIKSGEIWSFVFTKQGAYQYHDHVWPHLGGQIIVSDPENTVLQNKNIFSHFIDYTRKVLFKILDFFTGNEGNNKERSVLKSGNTNTDFYKNLKSHFEEIVLESDPREALHELRERSSTDKQTLALCHDILHVIGHTAYHKYGSFSEAIKYQSDFCNSGYIHGLFESYFSTTKNPLVGLSEQCNNFAAGKRQFDLWQCHHGVGHGFMYFTGGDLDKSLQLCTDGLQTPEAVSSCQNGVYMEVFNLEILAKEKDLVNPENPFLTCQSRETNKGDCYLYIPTYLSQTLGKDFVDIFKECDKAESGYAYSCIDGIASEAIKRNMSEPNNVFALCKQAGSGINQKACVSGMVSMYMNQEGSLSAGKKLCEAAPEIYQDICYRTVESRELFFK